MKVQLARPRRSWLGSWTIPTAANRHPVGVYLNRYPHEVIGLWLSWGSRRYLSWVWPVWVTGLQLTHGQRELA